MSEQAAGGNPAGGMNLTFFAQIGFIFVMLIVLLGSGLRWTTAVLIFGSVNYLGFVVGLHNATASQQRERRRVLIVDNDASIRDLMSKTLQLTPGSKEAEQSPVWSPDGTRIAFASDHALYERNASGAAAEESLLLKSEAPLIVRDWSRDGRFLLYQEFEEPRRYTEDSP